MTRAMIGPILLLAAMVSSEARSAPPTPAGTAMFQPTGGATAQATASIRIVSGVRFGLDFTEEAAGATRRPALLVDRDGQSRPAELLEFQ